MRTMTEQQVRDRAAVWQRAGGELERIIGELDALCRLKDDSVTVPRLQRLKEERDNA